MIYVYLSLSISRDIGVRIPPMRRCLVASPSHSPCLASSFVALFSSPLLCVLWFVVYIILCVGCLYDSAPLLYVCCWLPVISIDYSRSGCGVGFAAQPCSKEACGRRVRVLHLHTPIHTQVHLPVYIQRYRY